MGALANRSAPVARSTGAPWSARPTHLRDGVPVVTDLAGAGAAGADQARVWTHVWAQWQLASWMRKRPGEACTLYLDLPVGVSADAYEVWRHRDRFLTTLAAGAPPDALFLGGQDWGLPPLHPERERAAGYAYVRACLAAHMRHARMLRIDHVMGLYRLYCVPRGMAATDGVYIRYRADELYALVTLESHRHQCAVAGEDLGTVPPEVRPALARHGIARLYVGQFNMPATAAEAMTRFLHNGALDSLDQLLCLAPRPDVPAPAFGSGGHTFGCELPDADRRALVAYLNAH